MASFIRKTLKKIPPLRYLVRLLRLPGEFDSLKKETASLRKELASEKKETTSLRKELTAEKKETASLRKELAAEKKEITALKKELRITKREQQYYYFKGLLPEQYPAAAKEWYFQSTGKVLNLEHPVSYNEKIQWLKLFDSTPLKTKLADKYLVRDWVREKIGEKYLVPLLGVYEQFDDINFDLLPDKFVIKTNHACATNRIVTDKAKFDKKEARVFFNMWLNRNYAFWNGLQLHYKDIHPLLIVEEYLENDGGNLNDYKVFCFDGKARYIMFMTGRTDDLRKVIYDTEWKRMPFLDGHNLFEEPVPKPDNLDELIHLAEILSEGFSHVRVDFYRLNNGNIKFGEMTFTPTSGKVLWEPEEYEQMLGNLIHLPCDESPL